MFGEVAVAAASQRQCWRLALFNMCFHSTNELIRYEKAMGTVEGNKPANYIASAPAPAAGETSK